MTRKAKLTKGDCEQIAKLINEGHEIKDLAKKFGVHRSVISRRCKAMYQSKKIPVKTRNRFIKDAKVKEIKISTESITNEEGRNSNVSSIEIILTTKLKSK